jgi:cytochrome b subunit of formate dehydrogenase
MDTLATILLLFFGAVGATVILVVALYFYDKYTTTPEDIERALNEQRRTRFR